jgi:hypothetical protein
LINNAAISVVLPRSDHLPSVTFRFDPDQFIAITNREALDVRASHADDVSRSFSAFSSALGPTVETKNEGTHGECDDQQN